MCYKDIELSHVLIDFYTEMVESNLKIDSGSGGIGLQSIEDVLYHCAFNFPAVLYTLGKD